MFAGSDYPQSIISPISNKMGGGKKFEFPKYVWSPAGGWWCNPRNWRRNTVVAFGMLFAISVPIAYTGLQLERRPVPPYRHIFSQRLAKHAKEDDPSLPENFRILK